MDFTMSWLVVSNALLIFNLRVADVSLGTIRTIMIMRGQRYWAALLGFIEVTIWVLAVARVIGDLDSFWSVIGYSGGFAMGTLLGVWLENKLALGYVNIRIVSMSQWQKIVEQVREAGYGATHLQAEGRSGPVHIIDIVATRRQIAHLLGLVNAVDARSFVTIEETRQVFNGYRRGYQRPGK